MPGGDFHIFGWAAMLGFLFGVFAYVWMMTEEDDVAKPAHPEARKGVEMDSRVFKKAA